MNADAIVYEHEDVFTSAGQTGNYLANWSGFWPFSGESRWTLFGIFGQLRPSGTWPRAVNLWETTMEKFCLANEQQFFDMTPRMDAHWLKSNTQRTGGWDRLCVPGPGSPGLRGAAQGEKRPCVIQQYVRLRNGAVDDYLEWVHERVAPRVAETGWRTLLWMGGLHSSVAIVYHAAPSWDRLVDLASAIPAPDKAWEAISDNAALHAFPQSTYLKRD